jgi:hypothetical protein
MPKNTLTAFFWSGSMGFIGGMLSLLLTGIFFAQNLSSEKDSTLGECVAIGIIIDVFLPFFFCLGFLLPLAIIEKEKMEEKSFLDLIKRYTPILTVPFGALFFWVLLDSCNDEIDKYFFLVTLINIFSICVFCLVFFLKKIKSI